MKIRVFDEGFPDLLSQIPTRFHVRRVVDAADQAVLPDLLGLRLDRASFSRKEFLERMTENDADRGVRTRIRSRASGHRNARNDRGIDIVGPLPLIQILKGFRFFRDRVGHFFQKGFHGVVFTIRKNAYSRSEKRARIEVCLDSGLIALISGAILLEVTKLFVILAFNRRTWPWRRRNFESGIERITREGRIREKSEEDEKPGFQPYSQST